MAQVDPPALVRLSEGLGPTLPKREVLSVVALWTMAGHITERGFTCEAGDAILAAVDAEVAAERERCAKLCEELGRGWARDEVSAQECADAIRGPNVELTGRTRSGSAPG